LQNAFQGPARTHRAGKGNVPEIKMLLSVEGLSSCAKHRERHPSDTDSRLLTEINHGCISRSRLEDRQPAKCSVGDSSDGTPSDSADIGSIIEIAVQAAISEFVPDYFIW
jgi:hypothetical protein